MGLQAKSILQRTAEVLHVSEDELLRKGLDSFLTRQLREVKAEIFDIHSRYDVSSVEEMQTRYKDGSLDEADSWRDLQRLDHLEYKRDQLTRLLDSIQ